MSSMNDLKVSQNLTSTFVDLTIFFVLQILSLDTLTWATATSNVYSSPGGVSLKIPACRGHALVQF